MKQHPCWAWGDARRNFASAREAMRRNTSKPHLLAQKLSRSALRPANVATNSENERASDCSVRSGQCTFVKPSQGHGVYVPTKTTTSSDHIETSVSASKDLPAQCIGLSRARTVARGPHARFRRLRKALLPVLRHFLIGQQKQQHIGGGVVE